MLKDVLIGTVGLIDFADVMVVPIVEFWEVTWILPPEIVELIETVCVFVEVDRNVGPDEVVFVAEDKGETED